MAELPGGGYFYWFRVGTSRFLLVAIAELPGGGYFSLSSDDSEDLRMVAMGVLPVGGYFDRTPTPTRTGTDSAVMIEKINWTSCHFSSHALA